MAEDYNSLNLANLFREIGRGIGEVIKGDPTYQTSVFGPLLPPGACSRLDSVEAPDTSKLYYRGEEEELLPRLCDAMPCKWEWTTDEDGVERVHHCARSDTHLRRVNQTLVIHRCLCGSVHREPFVPAEPAELCGQEYGYQTCRRVKGHPGIHHV